MKLLCTLPFRLFNANHYFVFLGFIVDYVGRRMAIIINSVLFLVGAIILALAPSFAVLVSLKKSA